MGTKGARWHEGTGRHKHVHRVSTSSFNHLAKIMHILKVESQSFKNWSRYCIDDNVKLWLKHRFATLVSIISQNSSCYEANWLKIDLEIDDNVHSYCKHRVATLCLVAIVSIDWEGCKQIKKWSRSRLMIICSFGWNRVATPCFDSHAKIMPVLKVISKSIKILSRIMPFVKVTSKSFKNYTIYCQ